MAKQAAAFLIGAILASIIWAGFVFDLDPLIAVGFIVAVFLSTFWLAAHWEN